MVCLPACIQPPPCCCGLSLACPCPAGLPLACLAIGLVSGALVWATLSCCMRLMLCACSAFSFSSTPACSAARSALRAVCAGTEQTVAGVTTNNSKAGDAPETQQQRVLQHTSSNAPALSTSSPAQQRVRQPSPPPTSAARSCMPPPGPCSCDSPQPPGRRAPQQPEQQLSPPGSPGPGLAAAWWQPLPPTARLLPWPARS
jgi:hypothetical protein